MNTTPFMNESSCAYLSNALNEVLNGFRVDYEKTLGTERGSVRRLFEKLRSVCDQKAPLLQRISPEEARIILKCSDLCLRELDADEFEVRLGEAPEAARRINQEVSSYVEADPLSS